MKENIERNNEITVRINCSSQEIDKTLIGKGFKVINDYHLEDMYFVPIQLCVERLSIREMLKSAVILRDYNGHMPEHRECELTRKNKEINEKGEIVSQTQVNCPIKDIQAGIMFLESIGYKCIIHIVEDGKLYERDGLKINTKDIKNGDNLIEMEENEQFDTIEKLKAKLYELDLPIDESDYFVKKAEVELQKKMSHKEEICLN